MKFVDGKPLFDATGPVLDDQDGCCCGDTVACSEVNGQVYYFTAEVYDESYIIVNLDLPALADGATYQVGNPFYGGEWTTETTDFAKAQAVALSAEEESPSGAYTAPYDRGVFESPGNEPAITYFDGSRVRSYYAVPSDRLKAAAFVIGINAITSDGQACATAYGIGLFTANCGTVTQHDIASYQQAVGYDILADQTQSQQVIGKSIRFDLTAEIEVTTVRSFSPSCSGSFADTLATYTASAIFVVDGQQGGAAGTFEDFDYVDTLYHGELLYNCDSTPPPDPCNSPTVIPGNTLDEGVMIRVTSGNLVLGWHTAILGTGQTAMSAIYFLTNACGGAAYTGDDGYRNIEQSTATNPGGTNCVDSYNYNSGTTWPVAFGAVLESRISGTVEII